MNAPQQHSLGFTIVELLIVIVVIGILAAITMTTYRGIQNRANDVAVQSDLKTMAQLLQISNVDSAVYPIDEATLSVIGLKASKGAYGNDLVSGGMKYNLLYCSTVASYGGPANFALVASSKSSNVYAVSGDNTQVRTLPASSWTGGWGTICPAMLNVAAGSSGTGVWLYENSTWKVWV